MEAPASCWLPAVEAPLELLPRVLGMLGVLCGFMMCMCLLANSCLCAAAASVELYLVGCLVVHPKTLHWYCCESCPSAARSRVMARQTRVSTLLASQGPHLGYVCRTPQIFIMTDLRRTDTTESRGRLYVPRGKRASPCAGDRGMKSPEK